MGVTRGLGKGLGALLGSNYSSEEEGQDNITMLHIHAIQPNAFQPRKDFTPESLSELSQSILAQGVLQPIIVRTSKNGDNYELIAGERRWRATQLAGLQEIPAIIREMSDKESLELALVENVQREDLNAIEQAAALQQLQSNFQVTQQELAKRTGLSRSHIANLMRLLHLPASIQEDIRCQRYSSGHGRVLSGITDPKSQEALRTKIIEDDLSVRTCEKLAAQWKKIGVFPFEKNIKKPEKKDKQDNVLARYEQQVHAVLGAKKVRFRGSSERGSMTISYGSRAEFLQIMAKIGVREEDHAV